MTAAKDFVDISDNILNDYDNESDLSESFLSEGSTAQSPMIVDWLEINMNNNKFCKTLIVKENSMKNTNVYDIKSDSKKFHIKVSSFDQSTSKDYKSLNISKESNVQLSNTRDESSKYPLSSRKSPQTLKDEIKYLLRKLANERLINSEWKSLSLNNKITEWKGSMLIDSDMINKASQNISVSANKMSKCRISDAPNFPEDISMWHILPNWDLDSLFN